MDWAWRVLPTSETEAYTLRVRPPLAQHGETPQSTDPAIERMVFFDPGKGFRAVILLSPNPSTALPLRRCV
jgi:hypothetical protein